MNVQKLEHGQRVTARCGKAGERGIVWGPWKTMTLHVQHDKKGNVSIVALEGVDWAEYAPSDFNGEMFVAEDYYMQVVPDAY